MFRQRGLHFVIPAKIEQIVAGQTPQQKLHRQIVDVALPVFGWRRWLRRQHFCQHAAQRLPPLLRCHLLGGSEPEMLPLAGERGVETCFIEFLLRHINPFESVNGKAGRAQEVNG